MVEVEVTGSPEVDVAVTVNGVWSIVLVPGLTKVMVWVALADGERSGHRGGRLVGQVAGLAGRDRAGPGGEEGDRGRVTVHTAGVVEVSVTGRPELAVGATAPGSGPGSWRLGS